MKLFRVALLMLPSLLAGCGDSTPSTTLSVTCGGSLSLAGAKSIDVSPDPAAGAVLSYPDPVNQGQTGNITVRQGSHCTIAPTGKV
jgi:hypothetical protein